MTDVLNIEPGVFKQNLLVTQQYCHLQMSYMVADDSLIDNASVFRSFNPEIDEKEIFEFGVWKPEGARMYKTVDWTSNPIENTSLINNLYRDQLEYKNQCGDAMSQQLVYKGDIIITRIDETLFDGASAACSYYLFDDFDLPPIDTWFYLTNSARGRLLFGWIPKEYRMLASDAAMVNCVDCIGWFSDWYPQEYGTHCLSDYVG